MMVKGLTASLIVNRIFAPKPGDVVLIHAAASGVGMILAQWAKHLGATVIGTVGSKAKAEIAHAHGCDHTILYRETDFVAAVKRIAPKGVNAVLDGVGKDTFTPSLDCIRPFGIIVNYGNASGHVPPLDIMELSRKGALSVSRPGLSHYLKDIDEFRAAADELFGLVEDGTIRIEISRSYALKDAAEAHRDVEARKFAGSVVLVP
jgi:NADPH2:quinone reductase